MDDVFTLTTDSQFVRTRRDLSTVDLYVVEYLGDPYDCEMIRINGKDNWRSIEGTKVGPSSDSKYKALKVHGVEIRGDLLAELIKDLTLTGPNGQTSSTNLIVNREGFCYLYVGGPSIKRLRINDYFGWSKYGVNPRIASDTMWNRCDMNTGAVLVTVAELKKKKDEENEVAVLRQLVRRFEESDLMMKKSVEEKDKQLARLMEAIRALVT